MSPSGNAVAGRLSPLLTFDQSGPRPAVPSRSGLKIEVEIAIRLSSSLPPRKLEYSRDEVVLAVHRLYLGLEVIDSRVEEGSEAPFLLYLADRFGNAGYVLGPELPCDLLDGVV